MKRQLPFPVVVLATLSLASCSRVARTPPAVGDVTSQASAVVPTAESIDQLRNHSNELANELADTRAALAASEKARQRLQETLEDIGQRLAQSEKDNAARGQELEQQRKRLAALDATGAEQQQATSTVKDLDTQVEALKASGAEQNVAKQHLEQRTLRTDPEQTERRSAERMRELEARAKELDAAKAELQTLQRETEERKAKAEGLQRQIAELHASASQRDNEQRVKDEKASAQIAELSARAEKLEQELSTSRQAREASAASAERVEREQTSVSAELAGLSHRSDETALADRAVLTKRLGDLDREGRALDANRRGQQARIAELEKELADVKKSSQSRLEALESVLQNTRASGRDLRTQLDAERARNTELTQQVGDLNGNIHKVHDLRTTLVEKQRRLDELDSDKTADSDEVKKLKLQVATLETDLNKARSVQQTSTTSVNDLIQKSSTPDADAPPPGTDNADVREQLSLERERRQTLEREVQRLTASGNNEERYMELWKALQSARSEILVLSNQLADERRSREQFEVALARLREQGGAEAKSEGDFAARLSDTLKERRAEADRLAEELKTANETIVRLKGRLEASASPLAENKALADLDKENEGLRRSLAAAEAAKEALQAKADMAEHLAEMVYGKFQ